MRRSLLLNTVLGLIVVGLAGGGYYLTSAKKTSTVSTQNLSTAKTGIVLSSVSATGNVEATTSLGVNFQQNGRVTAINVKAGDHVDAGTVLANVENATQASALASAKAQVASAQAQLAGKERGLTDAEKAQNQASLQQTQVSLDNANTALAHAKQTAAANATKYQLSVTQAADAATAARNTASANTTKYALAVTQAQSQLDIANTDSARAQSSYSSAQSAMHSLQGSYDTSASTSETPTALVNRYRLDQADCQANTATTNYHTSDGVDCSQESNLLSMAQNMLSAETSANQAIETVASATRSLDTAKQNQTAGLLSDQQQIASADRSVDTAKQNQAAGLLQDQQQIETSEGSLQTAQASLDSAKASNTVKEAPAKPEDIAQAQASVASAKSSLVTAQRNYDDTVLKAPVAGTVASISGIVGEYSSGGSSGSSGSSGSTSGSSSSSSSSASTSSASGFVVLTDVDVLDVKVGFTETDAAKVHVGQKATITIDALGTQTSAGTVISLDLDKTLVNNVVTYYAKVAFDAAPAGVKPGMTASVGVVLDKRENVVTLPTSAVPTQGTSATVTVRDDAGEDSTRTVGIGLRGDNAVEITSGLKAGEKVVTTSTAASGGGTGGFQPPGGGGLGGGIGR